MNELESVLNYVSVNTLLGYIGTALPAMLISNS